MNKLDETIVYAFEQLLVYAKYLEENESLTYQRLADRVETYKKSTEQYVCKSYFDETNVLKECTCGECK